MFTARRLFTRGETQAIVTTTLGTKMDEQYMDDIEKGEVKRRFMLHYNFPPYSVGEAGRFGGTSRRETGHGNLARRAIEAVLPDDDDFPYTLRIVSDITESNGSSSMASVCGGILSLMDAGVPIKKSGRGCCDGPGDGRESLRDPFGHRRCRRPLRRHGL